MTGSSMSAAWYLQRRLISSWLRRSIRSPLFWIITVLFGFALFSQLVAIIQSGEQEWPEWYRAEYLELTGAVLLAVGLLFGLWRATSTTPPASMADVLLLMRSPVPPRLQFSLVAIRPIFTNMFILGGWAMIGTGGLAVSIGDTWLAARIFMTIALVVLISEVLRFTLWIWLDDIGKRSTERARRIRSGIRFLVVGVAAGLSAILVLPVLDADLADLEEVVDALITAGEAVAALPPLSLAGTALAPGGGTGLAALSLLLTATAIAAFGLYRTDDFVEPLAITAERRTDPRGQMLEAGSDIQWAALAQYGVSPRQRVRVPPFASGPWALLWGGLVRWIRYQVAALWLTLAILAPIGVLAGLAVRAGFFDESIAWIAALMMPFFGSINMFMDDLRRQFIFLVPGSSWQRLFAAAIPSALDGFISGTFMVLMLVIVGAVPIGQAGALVVLAGAISILAQSSLALTQIILPYWVGQRMRVSITLTVTGVAFSPALVALIILITVTSTPLAMIVSAAVTAITGIVIFVAAGLMFDRIEFSG